MRDEGLMMQKQIAEGLLLFLDDDNGFIEWCEEHPDGFFWNCLRNKDGHTVRPYMLHGAKKNGMLCQHFRNSNRASGIEANLTTNEYCKVCSIERETIERWATEWGELKYCSSCIGLP
jgi:hypothetical protein